MATAKAAAGAARAGGPPLPKLSVARFREATRLVERLYAEQVDVFLAAGQDYRERHRDVSSRPLTAVEVAQISAGLGATLTDAKAQITDAGLTHYDEPLAQEYLLAAGVATAPAFLDAGLRLAALLELPQDVFVEACESGEARDELDAAIAAYVAEHFDDLDVEDMRKRAGRAFDLLARKSGVEPGKAWALVGRTTWKALQQAVTQLSHAQPQTSLSTSSTPSAAPTEDSPDETSSTTSPGATPTS